jgi:hypothetical protein
LYMTSAEITAAATGSGTASLGITGNETIAYPVCNSSLTTSFGRWNYVSIPLELSDGNIVTELGSIAGKYDLAYEYNHSSGTFLYYYEPFSTGTLTTLNDGRCYLIKAVENTVTNFNGTAALTNVAHDVVTSNGRWNYVGWVAEETDISSAFASIDGSYDLSYVYNNSNGQFAYYYAPFETGTYNLITPCDCQLIKGTASDTLDYTIS